MSNMNMPILVSTTPTIPGYRTTGYCGMAFGATVRSRGAAGDACAGCQSCCGGEVTKYTEMSIESRNQAIQRMVDHAASMGANVIASIHFDSDQIGQGANNSTIVYGTAVTIVPEN